VVAIDRRIAVVRCGLECAVVRLHNVYLWAPLASDLVRVTIVRGVLACAFDGLSRDIERGRCYEVEGQVATTTHMTEIHGEFDAPADEVELLNAVGVAVPLARVD
jgi:hypothetical protein